MLLCFAYFNNPGRRANRLYCSCYMFQKGNIKFSFSVNESREGSKIGENYFLYLVYYLFRNAQNWGEYLNIAKEH